MVQRIFTERNILIALDHPFIVKMYHSFQTEKKLFFVLEYCHGGEFFNYLSIKKTLNEDQAKFYASQIVLAI